MLGAIVGQYRIGGVALQQLRRPFFPLAQKLDKTFYTLVGVMGAQHFRRAGWRASTGIEEGDISLPPREGLVDDRNIADNHGKKTKAYTSLCNSEDAPNPVSGVTSPYPSVTNVVPLM